MDWSLHTGGLPPPLRTPGTHTRPRLVYVMTFPGDSSYPPAPSTLTHSCSSDTNSRGLTPCFSDPLTPPLGESRPDNRRRCDASVPPGDNYPHSRHLHTYRAPPSLPAAALVASNTHLYKRIQPLSMKKNNIIQQ